MLPMTTTTVATRTFTTRLSGRDRAVLRAVAQGRCAITVTGALTVDGYCLSDQFEGPRLTAAGLIVAGAGRAKLTATGLANNQITYSFFI